MRQRAKVNNWRGAVHNCIGINSGRPLWQFGCRVGGTMAKGANGRSSSRRTSATSSLSWAWAKIPSEIKRVEREPNLSRRMFLKLQYATAAGC